MLEVEGDRIVSRRELLLDADPIRKTAQIAAEGIEEFLCGAITVPLAEALAARGVRMHPFLAGDLEDVIHGYLEGALDHPRYSMPGCSGRRAGAGRNGP